MKTLPALSRSLRATCLFGLVVTTLGCSDSALSAARQSWAQTATTCPTYHYAISTSSFSGTGTKTTIEIAAGKPSARRYEQFHFDYSAGAANALKIVDKTWTETGASVGTHVEGVPAKTMETLYDDCARDVEPQDPAKNEIKIETDARGVLRECWYVPRQCADDCKMGVSVEDFACGALMTP
jgi:hypothetical protein